MTRRLIAVAMLGLAALAVLAVVIDERVSRHQSAWDRDYGGKPMVQEDFAPGTWRNR